MNTLLLALMKERGVEMSMRVRDTVLVSYQGRSATFVYAHDPLFTFVSVPDEYYVDVFLWLFADAAVLFKSGIEEHQRDLGVSYHEAMILYDADMKQSLELKSLLGDDFEVFLRIVGETK